MTNNEDDWSEPGCCPGCGALGDEPCKAGCAAAVSDFYTEDEEGDWEWEP